MPYLRLYLPEISVVQKRRLAQQLIETTLRTYPFFDRHDITIQFLPLARSRRHSRCAVEVRGHDLPAENRSVFAEAAATLLAHSLRLKVKDKWAWLLGGQSAMSPPVDVEFFELPRNTGEWIGDVSADDWKSEFEISRNRSAA